MRSTDQNIGAAGDASPEEHLDPTGIEALAAAFERWHAASARPATRLARARVLALFLLLRHTGAKLSEILELDLARDLDLDVGLVRFGERETALCEEGRRELAAIVPLILEKDGKGNLSIDPGYCRRVFAERGAEAGLSRDLSNPRSLRRYRGMELSMLGAPESVIRRILGRKPQPGPSVISGQEVLAAAEHYSRREVRGATSARNSFFGKVERVGAGDIQSVVELRTISGARISAIITNESVSRLRLAPGAWISALVKAPWVIVAKGKNPPPTSAENALAGRVRRVDYGLTTAEIVMELGDKSALCALVGRDAADGLALKPGDAVWALFSANAVILSAQ
jgi:molybdate transport system regulatory protein